MLLMLNVKSREAKKINALRRLSEAMSEES